VRRYIGETTADKPSETHIAFDRKVLPEAADVQIIGDPSASA